MIPCLMLGAGSMPSASNTILHRAGANRLGSPKELAHRINGKLSALSQTAGT